MCAVSGTIQLETGSELKGEIRFPPNDEIEIVLTDSRDKATVPIEDVKMIEVAAAPASERGDVPPLKRFWRRLVGPSKTEQMLTVTLRNGEVYKGWLCWRQSEGAIEVRPSRYVVQKVYLRSTQIDRERHHPVDVTRQYVRSVTFRDTETVVPKKCPKCGRSFEESDYKYCPFDGTPLTEPAVSVQD